MKANDCSGLPAMERCDADLPDSPQCAPNYHFGMLLGVADFRAEQGFHVGRLRRHHRLLHGSGVVAGYAVSYQAGEQELRVGTGLAIDALGRDLVLEVPQCVSLPLWWLAHREDEAFADIATPDDATLDLDVVACYSCCLGNPVPAIAEPCAGNASDIAYSRVCETVQLRLVRTPAAPLVPKPLPFHLLRMWLGLAGPRKDELEDVLPADQWLIDRYNALKALPAPQQEAERPSLLREILARAVSEQELAPPAADPDEPDEMALCLPLARLRQLRLKLEPDGWKLTLGSLAMGLRETLLPTSLLQQLLLGEPAPQPALAGPTVMRDSADLVGQTVTLVFSQPLAAPSVLSAFTAAEFDATQGWKPFTLAPPVYDGSDAARPEVTLTLDRAPTGKLLRITVAGTGSAPLLGATFIPAGAVTPMGEGRNLSTTIFRS
ncbi:MAG: hypothetical protein JWQ76_5213 [Ramlibacter sp.]|nr:hypothetical protein [Ramlibacter sp.]